MTATTSKKNGKPAQRAAKAAATNGEKVERPRRSFWEQTWQAPRVKMALESMGVKPADFEKAYNALPSSGRHGPTEAEIVAVKAFQKDGNFAKLKDTLGVKTPDAVGRTLARVEAHLASA